MQKRKFNAVFSIFYVEFCSASVAVAVAVNAGRGRGRGSGRGGGREIAIVTTFVVVFVTMVIVVVVGFGGPTFLVADVTKLYIGHLRIQIHHHEIQRYTNTYIRICKYEMHKYIYIYII